MPRGTGTSPCDAHLLQAGNAPAALASRRPLLHLSQFGPGLPARQECPKPFLENHNSDGHIFFSKTAFFNQLNTIHTPNSSSEIFKKIKSQIKAHRTVPS
jgi:hypothetical protein